MGFPFFTDLSAKFRGSIIEENPMVFVPLYRVKK